MWFPLLTDAEPDAVRDSLGDAYVGVDLAASPSRTALSFFGVDRQTSSLKLAGTFIISSGMSIREAIEYLKRTGVLMYSGEPPRVLPGVTSQGPKEETMFEVPLADSDHVIKVDGLNGPAPFAHRFELPDRYPPRRRDFRLCVDCAGMTASAPEAAGNCAYRAFMEAKQTDGRMEVSNDGTTWMRLTGGFKTLETFRYWRLVPEEALVEMTDPRWEVVPAEWEGSWSCTQAVPNRKKLCGDLASHALIDRDTQGTVEGGAGACDTCWIAGRREPLEGQTAKPIPKMACTEMAAAGQIHCGEPAKHAGPHVFGRHTGETLESYRKRIGLLSGDSANPTKCSKDARCGEICQGGCWSANHVGGRETPGQPHFCSPSCREGYEAANVSRSTLAATAPLLCRLGLTCPMHYPKKPDPFIPEVSDMDLLPDASPMLLGGVRYRR